MTTAPRSGIELRVAAPSDAEGVARVHVRTWQAAYRGLLADAYLDSLRAEERAARYTFDRTDDDSPTTIVAVERQAILGFATVARAQHAQGAGELSALHVAPEHWDRGIGRMLIQAARARLAQRGFREARLWLLEGNRRGERFYRIDGWTPDGERRRAVVWGAEVLEIGFRRELP